MLRLVEPMIPALRRYARALLRDRATADDLVQDCLEHAIARWRQRRADGDARAWLFAILHNLAISHLRRTARRGVPAHLDNVAEGALSIAPAQEDGLRLANLMTALHALPDEQRAVLLLVSVEDMSYAQAAGVLGVPVGTVMSRLARGRERLRGIVADGMVAENGMATPRPALRRVR